MKLLLVAVLAVLMTPITASEIHPEVQAALDWTLPENTCGPMPRLRKGSDYSSEDQQAAMSDVDHYTRGRYKRAMKRWEKCGEKYRAGLVADFSRLKDSVRHGMTPAQAETVLAKLKLIQDTVEASR